MATFEIFNDENVQAQSKFANNRKSKRPEGLSNKSNKRTALGNITNVSRVQPSRAAKLKEKKSQEEAKKNGNDFHIDHSFDCSLEKNTKMQCLESLSSHDGRQRLSSLGDDCKFEGSPMVLSTTPARSSSSDCLIEIESDLADDEAIEDIDQRLDITTGVREYAADIHTYLKQAEQLHRPKASYIKKQADINSNMRAILVDWLVEVSEEYKLLPQTLFLTVNYIDRFLSYMSVVRGKLQLVGTACMLVAAKFEEIYPPEVSEFVYITDDTYTAKQVLRMEHLILKTLSFDVSVPTALNFAQRYLLAADAEKDGQLTHLTNYLCELSLVNIEPFVKYLPSEIAASSLFLANLTLGNQTWTPTLEHYSGYCISDISPCIRDLHSTFLTVSEWTQQAIQSRYKSARFGSVSTLTPPQLHELC